MEQTVNPNWISILKLNKLKEERLYNEFSTCCKILNINEVDAVACYTNNVVGITYNIALYYKTGRAKNSYKDGYAEDIIKTYTYLTSGLNKVGFFRNRELESSERMALCELVQNNYTRVTDVERYLTLTNVSPYVALVVTEYLRETDSNTITSMFSGEELENWMYSAYVGAGQDFRKSLLKYGVFVIQKYLDECLRNSV